MKNKKGQVEFSNFIMLITFLVIVFVSGIIGGLIYYDLGLLDTTLHTINFQIPIQDNSTLTNTSITDFQDIMEIVVYPILGLRTSLPYLVYFMIFGFIMSLGITAYLSSKNPIFFILHVLFTSLITYFSIILSGAYINLLSNPFINNIMTPFTIYNKLMIYLPQIIFFTSLLFGIIAFINLMKPIANTQLNQTSLNYGGDY
jgi:hypothetical protein